MQQQQQPTPSAAGATQFLSSVLSQRGPDALPYAEDTKYLIRHHLVSLNESFPSLVPKASHFVHNDGRSVRLLQADGTIPIVYGGAIYNLPATVWLLETYPRSPPSVYLSPTRDMVVKLNHPHVDRSGHVSVPYLRSWVFPSSNLVDLVRSLSHLFGQDPPLYSRQQPPAAPSTTTYSAHSRPATPSSASSSFSASPYGGRLGNPNPNPNPNPAPARPPTEDAAEVFHRNAVNKIVEKAHADLLALRKRTEAEMEGLFAAQAEMRRREEALAVGVNQMVEEKEALEQQLQIVLMNADVLEGWLRENGGKMAEGFNVNDAIVPADALSRQVLECTATDLAVEDTIYALDQALQKGVVTFEMYRKAVKELSRDQFFERATLLKVKAAQMQMRVNTMAARVPQYAV